MRFLKRMSGLITANLNDLIDQCENPETMLRQAVRDMETALGQLLDGAARAIAHHKLLSRQVGEQREATDRCLKMATSAVERGDDESARSYLQRKAEHQQLDEALSRQVISANTLAQRLKRQVTAMRIKLAEARRKLIEITTRNQAAAVQRKFAQQLPNDARLDRVWSNFDAMCARVAQSESEAEALLELLGEADTTESLDADVEAELRALKEAVSHVAS